MQLAQGNVDDRPFARTIFTLAAKRFTGDLVLTHQGREYRTSWENGLVVAAASPSPADTPGRIALQHGLVTSSALAQIVQTLAQNPGADAIAVIAESARLSGEQTAQLRRRVLAHTAARIFALPGATFVVDNARTMKAHADVPGLDPRWLVYFGLRTHYPIERLEKEMSAVGQRVLGLSPSASDAFAHFGFGSAEKAALERLAARPMSLDDFVRASTELERTTAIAVIYAMTACDYVRLGAASATPTTPESSAIPNPVKLSPSTRTRRPTTRSRIASQAPPITQAPSEGSAAANSQTRVKRATASPLARGSMHSASFVQPDPERPRARSATQSATPAAEEIERIILDKIALLDKDADHYSLLGVGKSDPPDKIRTAYFQLAKKLHPDRLRAVGVMGMDAEAQRLFSAINRAFSVLSDVKKANEYQKVLAAGGERAVRAAQHAVEEVASKIFAAEEHYHIGEMALRRDQYRQARDEFAKAVELSPEEGEYLALLAWTTYCAAPDKSAVEEEVKKKISSALLKAPKSVNAHLYHGKLMKLLERNEAAIEAFRKVVELSPGHHEAELELRLLSSRQKSPSSKGGLFSKLKR